MGWGTGNLGGGSGGGLNFKVVAYSTESNLLSATPKENTIGVITTNEITSWTFSATAPNSPVDGMVWFSLGTSSPVEFNALKKNAIQVYPQSAKQYVSGAWVDVSSKSYQGGAWQDWWAGELYSAGNQYDHITGGWKFVGGNQKFQFRESDIYFYPGGSENNNSGIYTNKKIDVSGFSTLSMTVDVVRPTTSSKLFLSTEQQDGTAVAQTALPNKTGLVTLSLDISGQTGSYYVGYFASLSEGYIQEIRLK